jgi:hypothetical protein
MSPIPKGEGSEVIWARTPLDRCFIIAWCKEKVVLKRRGNSPELAK